MSDTVKVEGPKMSTDKKICGECVFFLPEGDDSGLCTDVNAPTTAETSNGCWAHEVKTFYCVDCEKQIFSTLYNANVDPKVYICQECGQTVNKPF